MKKFLMIALVVAMMTALIAAPVMAAGKNGQSGKSNIGHLYLWEKDNTDWTILEGGAWGKMKYNLSGETFDFVFNGHELEPGLDYTLIYYPDPWPGNNLICLGTGTVCEDGNIHIKNSVKTGDLPIESDENDGAKIWLVLTDDVDCDNNVMIGWNGTEYLFEGALITFEDIN